MCSSSGGGQEHEAVELVPRSGQELYEMTCLVGELLPPLPGDGVFAVDGLLAPPGTRLRDGLASWGPVDSEPEPEHRNRNFLIAEPEP
jgi:E3 ubiquitin-protein ligase TRIP12